MEELQRYEHLVTDIHSNDPVVVGSERASNLKEAWTLRQYELREAMKSMMKPAEFMGNLSQQLQHHSDVFQELQQSTSHHEKDARLSIIKEQINQILIDLESLLTDIDNSRDFHTIGAWPTLVTLLQSSFPLSTRGKAAWVIGTALKNSYDYQLWVLEDLILGNSSSLGNSTTALELLLTMFQQSSRLVSQMRETDIFFEDALEFQKRSIYALSAAIRGNVEVQDHIYQNYYDRFFQSVEGFLSSGMSNAGEAINRTSHSSVMRKIFAMVSDLLEERKYIRFDLATSLEAEMENHLQVGEKDTIITGTIPLKNPDIAETSIPSVASITAQLENIRLLSDYFFMPRSENDWKVASLYFFRRYLQRLKTLETELRDQEDPPSSLRNERGNVAAAIESILRSLSSYLEQQPSQPALPPFFADGPTNSISQLELLSSLLRDLQFSFEGSPKYDEILVLARDLSKRLHSLAPSTSQ